MLKTLLGSMGAGLGPFANPFFGCRCPPAPTARYANNPEEPHPGDPPRPRGPRAGNPGDPVLAGAREFPAPGPGGGGAPRGGAPLIKDYLSLQGLRAPLS